MNIRLWGILAVLLVALGGLSWWLTTLQRLPEREVLKPPSPEKLKEMTNPKRGELKTATMQPGRVVVLNTSRGRVEFVLYEKDCPKTTARIAHLVQAGAYNGVAFTHAENWVIQAGPGSKQVPPMGIEIAKGLLHEKGSVGMARATGDVNSNTSEFYITLGPAHHMDLLYTNFGRVINGMDVATKIRPGDQIKTATLRPFTDIDRSAKSSEKS